MSWFAFSILILDRGTSTEWMRCLENPQTSFSILILDRGTPTPHEEYII